VTNELAIGRRYRITLRDPAFPGRLEGRLRSVRLPQGMLGNVDGEHSVWVSGESFEWFLRPDEIEAAQEMPEADEPSLLAFVPPRCCARRFPPPGPRRRARAATRARVDAMKRERFGGDA
jgi:hypothetical protein